MAGPNYVNIRLRTFCCSTCAGILREMQFPVKGISVGFLVLFLCTVFRILYLSPFPLPSYSAVQYLYTFFKYSPYVTPPFLSVLYLYYISTASPMHTGQISTSHIQHPTPHPHTTDDDILR